MKRKIEKVGSNNEKNLLKKNKQENKSKLIWQEKIKKSNDIFMGYDLLNKNLEILKIIKDNEISDMAKDSIKIYDNLKLIYQDFFEDKQEDFKEKNYFFLSNLKKEIAIEKKNLKKIYIEKWFFNTLDHVIISIYSLNTDYLEFLQFLIAFNIVIISKIDIIINKIANILNNFNHDKNNQKIVKTSQSAFGFDVLSLICSFVFNYNSIQDHHENLQYRFVCKAFNEYYFKFSNIILYTPFLNQVVTKNAITLELHQIRKSFFKGVIDFIKKRVIKTHDLAIVEKKIMNRIRKINYGFNGITKKLSDSDIKKILDNSDPMLEKKFLKKFTLKIISGLEFHSLLKSIGKVFMIDYRLEENVQTMCLLQILVHKKITKSNFKKFQDQLFDSTSLYCEIAHAREFYDSSVILILEKIED